MPEPSFMKLGKYIMPQEAISTVYVIYPISNTNIAASKIYETKTIILLE
jgi:hypothetical protein